MGSVRYRPKEEELEEMIQNEDYVEMPICPNCGEITHIGGEFLPCCGEDTFVVSEKGFEKWIRLVPKEINNNGGWI